ncbi:MAG: carboxylating nicotinate-nucleotide diphosphorylase [Elusimicrobia bacterium]|nr:carboxylating nicotinate-nucleotide diphosphorylase [Elusimicrobiota bacterium]MDE2238073.1 carboxylating nicotinate-nucleotide diphosphorylase [Elusimicrobiota bacterium]MDE2426185.1 carboxylating nicotinate-nucleotide diphosphorylase [Elusimicrobiota bacterium]
MKLKAADALIRLALAEDLGARGDVTTEVFVAPDAKLSGRVLAKQAGIVCGVELAAEVFRRVDRSCRAAILRGDGRRVLPGDTVLRLSGGRALLSAERIALNFLQRLSGVATLTAAYCARVKGTRARVYDTRKTLPGWRELDKYAVRCGGGANHRMGLYDAVLLKDNHWAGGRDVARGVRSARRSYPGVVVELEAANLEQARGAIAAGADVILLDNMPRPLLRRAIALIRKRAPKIEIEVSGGVSLSSIRALALLGPDRISVGRLTHSAPALDLSFELDQGP